MIFNTVSTKIVASHHAIFNKKKKIREVNFNQEISLHSLWIRSFPKILILSSDVKCKAKINRDRDSSLVHTHL